MLDTALRPKPTLVRARRATLRDLFGLAAPVLPEPETRAANPDGPPDAPAPAYPVHPARAAAHAAYRAVEGGGPKALDAALAVIEAEARALRLTVLRQEEALKLLRLYASDEWARLIAARVLDVPSDPLAPCLPASLYDRGLAEGATCCCGGHR